MDLASMSTIGNAKATLAGFLEMGQYPSMEESMLPNKRPTVVEFFLLIILAAAEIKKTV